MGKKQGEFSVIEVPAVIVSIQTFVNLQKEAEKIMGFDGAAVLFYEAGKNSGERWINRRRRYAPEAFHFSKPKPA